MALLFEFSHANAQAYAEVVFIDGHRNHNVDWKDVARQLKRHNISSVSIDSYASYIQVTPRRERSRFLITSTEVGLVIAKVADKEKSLIVKRLAFAESLSDTEIERIAQELSQVSDSVAGVNPSVSKTGLIALSDESWIKPLATGVESEDDWRSGRLKWIILSSDERALNPDWQFMMRKSIGAIVIEVIPDSLSADISAKEIARLISVQVNSSVLVAK